MNGQTESNRTLGETPRLPPRRAALLAGMGAAIPLLANVAVLFAGGFLTAGAYRLIDR